MGGQQLQYWCAVTNNPDWQPKLNDVLAFYIEQPEDGGEDYGWHRQGYAEFTTKVTMTGAREALGWPPLVRGKQNEGGYFYKVIPRNGTKEQNMRYCASSWYCHDCSIGDATELLNDGNEFGDYRTHQKVKPEEWSEPSLLSYNTQHVKTTDTREWRNHHTECGAKIKGKCGPIFMIGTPRREGHGVHNPNTKKGGSGDISREVLEAIKGGASMAEISEKYTRWVSGHVAWCRTMLEIYQCKPYLARYSLEECCNFLKQAPIEWDHPDWAHSVVVMGNPGTGKTQWALAHFKAPLYINRKDRMKCFDPARFDGIVFDDMNFNKEEAKCSRETQLALVEWSDPRDVACRYMDGHIPANTRKIFVCNYGHFPFMDDEALNERLCIIEVDPEMKSKRKPPVPRKAWVETKRLKASDDTQPPPKKTRSEKSLADEPKRRPSSTVGERCGFGKALAAEPVEVINPTPPAMDRPVFGVPFADIRPFEDDEATLQPNQETDDGGDVEVDFF